MVILGRLRAQSMVLSHCRVHPAALLNKISGLTQKGGSDSDLTQLQSITYGPT